MCVCVFSVALGLKRRRGVTKKECFGVKKVTKANVFVGKRRSEAKAHSDKLTKRPIGEWGPLFRIIVRRYFLYEVFHWLIANSHLIIIILGDVC